MRKAIWTAVAAGLVMATVGVLPASATTLKFGTFGSGKDPFHSFAVRVWMASTKAASGGKLTITQHLNTLGGARELYANARNGIADLVWVIAGAQRGYRFPRSNVLALPGVLDGYTNVHANIALWRLYENGLVAKDYSDVVPLAFASMSPVHFMTNGKNVSLANLSGMKLGVSSGLTAQTVKQIGAIPVFAPITGFYQAMSRRTVDGLVVGFTAVKAFRLDEVTNTHTVMPLNSPLVFIGANKKKLDALPAGERKALMSVSGEKFSRNLGLAGDRLVGYTRGALAKDPKQSVTDVPAAERAAWHKAVRPVIERWTKATPDGAAILAAYRAELERAKQGK